MKDKVGQIIGRKFGRDQQETAAAHKHERAWIGPTAPSYFLNSTSPHPTIWALMRLCDKRLPKLGLQRNNGLHLPYSGNHLRTRLEEIECKGQHGEGDKNSDYREKRQSQRDQDQPNYRKGRYRPRATAMLGVNRVSVWRRAKKYGIDLIDFGKR